MVVNNQPKQWWRSLPGARILNMRNFKANNAGTDTDDGKETDDLATDNRVSTPNVSELLGDCSTSGHALSPHLFMKSEREERSSPSTTATSESDGNMSELTVSYRARCELSGHTADRQGECGANRDFMAVLRLFDSDESDDSDAWTERESNTSTSSLEYSQEADEWFPRSIFSPDAIVAQVFSNHSIDTASLANDSIDTDTSTNFTTPGRHRPSSDSITTNDVVTRGKYQNPAPASIADESASASTTRTDTQDGDGEGHNTSKVKHKQDSNVLDYFHCLVSRLCQAGQDDSLEAAEWTEASSVFVPKTPSQPTVPIDVSLHSERSFGFEQILDPMNTEPSEKVEKTLASRVTVSSRSQDALETILEDEGDSKFGHFIDEDLNLSFITLDTQIQTELLSSIDLRDNTFTTMNECGANTFLRDDLSRFRDDISMESFKNDQADEDLEHSLVAYQRVASEYNHREGTSIE